MPRSYSDLCTRATFFARFEYLRLGGIVGEATFGYERHLNQAFYRSREWQRARDFVVTRENGCDLGDPDHQIRDRPIVHHMNPIRLEDLQDFNEDILNPEFLILTSHATHNAIHYGDVKLLPKPFVERTQGDTQLW